ncbi:MAG: ABC transporter permease [Anaerolineae bacterium]|nr:ABC transporter permease [Anaerolineae bacterium]
MHTSTRASASTAPISQPQPPSRLGAFGKGLARSVRTNPTGALGAVIVVLLVITALFAETIAPYSPTRQGAPRLLPPSPEHLMGTDRLGRDIFSRVVFGTRVSLYVGFVAVTIALIIGSIIGIVSGYWSGITDSLLMRFMDMLLAFPGLVLALLIAGLLGQGLTNTMIAVGIVAIPVYARVTRASVLEIVNRDYILAARAMGAGDRHTISRHVLPNILVPLIVLVTVSLSTAVLAESSLSFLGLGVVPPNPSWGGMLADGRTTLEIAPWQAIFAGAAIFVTVLAFNFLGDGLRDLLDPRMRGVGT